MDSLLEQHGWHEWLCHSNFSFLTGASSPEAYIERATTLGYKSLALTDYDGVYGIVRLHRWLKDRAKEHSLAPTDLPRPIYGAEIHLAPDHDDPIVLRRTIVLQALNLAGYGNLCRILSYAHRHGKNSAFVTPTELLAMPITGLVAILPMRGFIRRAPPRDHTWQLKIVSLREAFQDRFYFAVSRHLSPCEDTWITPTLAAARYFGCKTLLSQDAYFHAPSEKDLSDTIQAIRINKTIYDAGAYLFANGERHLMPLSLLARRYASLPNYAEALRDSAALAASFDFSLKELRYYYPKEMLPPGVDAQEYLELQTWQAAHQFYSSGLQDRIKALIIYELKLIGDLGFADYFLTIWDIVTWARSQNILCQGRGSAANSVVCFVLGITSVDPVNFDLLFERFISVERGDPPDIDVDFEHERREEVIQYIYSRYGRAKAAMVANVICFKTRGALRAVGKALGLPEAILGQASQVLESRAFRAKGCKATVEILKEDTQEQEYTEKTFALWGELAGRLKGFPRHLGIHSGGFMLADKPLDQLVPQEPATMVGRSVVQWCKEDIEALGFFKIDVLALGMLTAMRKTFDLISQHMGRQLTLKTIPADDQPTYDMIQRADTVGTFQIESRAQMSMLPRLKPATFYDLVIEVAIIRPGPIQGGMIHPFLKRRAGQEPVTYAHPLLEPILKRTLGIPIFQEQVMRVAMAIGGFSPGEADELRRHMGSWKFTGDIEPMIKKLTIGMRNNGIAEDFITSLIGQLHGFAHYGFPESHAASFALLAYASSYLKHYYPAPFFAALLNSQPMGFYTPHALLQTARRCGVSLRPVCVLSSDWDMTLEKCGHQHALRLGLRLVKGLSQKSAEALIQTRKKRATWTSFTEFLQTTSLPRDELSALAAADAFRGFGIERRHAIWTSEAAAFAPLLEEAFDADEQNPAIAPLWEQQSEFDVVLQDFASLGTSLRRHPTEIIRDKYWSFNISTNRLVKACDMLNQRPRSSLAVFGMVLVRQSPPTAKGMVFLTLEDETGFFNLVLRPNIYERFRLLIDRNTFLCVVGTLQVNGGAHSLLVQQILSPEITKAKVIELERSISDQELPNTATAGADVIRTRNYM